MRISNPLKRLLSAPKQELDTSRTAAETRKAREQRAKSRESRFRLFSSQNALTAATVCLALVITGLVFVVVRHSQGNATRSLPPDPGTVWVSSDKYGSFGRVNKPAGSLDAAFAAPGSGGKNAKLDILQSGTSIVARDRGSGRAYPVNASTGQLVPEDSAALAAGFQVDVGGSTTAAIDPLTGRVWAGRARPGESADVASLQSNIKPIEVVALSEDLTADERSAGLAISLRGTVVAASTQGDVLTLTPKSDAEGFEISKGSLGRSLSSVQVTMVGDTPVFLDALAHEVYLADGTAIELPTEEESLLLQRSSPSGDSVAITGDKELLTLNIVTEAVVQHPREFVGEATQPVVTDQCTYVAWGGTPASVARRCGEETEFTEVELEGDARVPNPNLRVNQRSAVLNESSSGAVWDLDTGAQLDNWTEIRPPEEKDKRKKKDKKKNRRPGEPERPTAVDDDLAARAGTASVLHLLDNDSNPSGSVLSIVEVSQPESGTASVTISPDGQSVQVDLQPNAGSANFSYTIDDGFEQRDSANVRVRIQPPGGNGTPKLRPNYRQPELKVVAGGRIDAPVVGDWRDPDNDVLALGGVSVSEGRVVASADGRIAFTAPSKPGSAKITYAVSDGREPTTGNLRINVLPGNSTELLAPDAQPDVVRGTAGRPIVVRPLDNDGPGLDALDPNAKLEIAGDAVAPKGVDVKTDTRGGTVTVQAEVPGTYLVNYEAKYGGAPYAKGVIRVDVAPTTENVCQAGVDTAVVVGQNPTTVDVLSNDLAPEGRLLTVQSAEVTNEDDIEVAVLRGQWVRIRPLKPKLGKETRVVRYRITDGRCPTVEGKIAVQQVPLPKASSPYTEDDKAVVRVGDSVTIPVLDNDIDPGGGLLRLVAEEGSAASGLKAGQLEITAPGARGGEDEDLELGHAYVSGNVVRYQAPRGIKSQRTVKISYLAENATLNRATGFAYVQIRPEPTPRQQNRAPSPPVIEARAVAGSQISIPIQTSGVDSDGDSVVSLGPIKAPRLGRILSSGPSSILYEAYPVSSDTDEFEYEVVDRFGKRGTGVVRVSVVPPGDPQPVVASDDYVTAAPGREVSVPVLDNDVIPLGDKPTLGELSLVNQGNALASSATLDTETGLLQVVAPQGKAPEVINYSVSGALGQPANGAVTIRPLEGHNAAPVARDAFVKPKAGAEELQVNLANKVRDPDGDDSELRITKIFGPEGATVAGGVATIPVAEQPQVLGYEVTDPDGATGFAAIYLPTDETNPFPKPDQLIRMEQNGTTTFEVSDYADDPAGKKLILTGKQLLASPPGKLAATSTSSTQVKLKAQNDYVGPAAVAFEVTNGSSEADPKGKRAFIIVPVQVGPEEPVLRCPDETFVLAQKGEGRELDIHSLCHVWLPPSMSEDDVRYAGSFPNGERGLKVENTSPHVLRVYADESASSDLQASMQVEVVGSQAARDSLGFEVAGAPPPTMSAIPPVTVEAGQAATFDIRNYVRSQLTDPDFNVVSVSAAGAQASAETETLSPTSFAITPSSAAEGRMVFTVTVSDVSDQTLRDRQAQGQVTLNVLGRPGKPSRPVRYGQVGDGVIFIDFSQPDSPGLAINNYIVTAENLQPQTCGAPPCRVVVENGTGYQFRVKAVNDVGEGEPSDPSEELFAAGLPGPPRELSTSDPGDGTLRISWARPADLNGGELSGYLLSYTSNKTGSARRISVSASATSAVADTLSNDSAVRFFVQAETQGGLSAREAASVEGQSAGRPQTPPAFSVTNRQPSGSGRVAAQLRWDGVEPNGPGPVTYRITRRGGGAERVMCESSATTCTDPFPVVADGTEYTYSVVALNLADFRSEPASASFVANLPPDKATGLNVEATGTNDQVRYSYKIPEINDSSATITCTVTVPGVGSAPCEGGSVNKWQAGQVRNGNVVVGGSNGSRATVTVKVENNAGESTATSAESDLIYGPPLPPIIDPNIITEADRVVVRFRLGYNGRGLGYNVNITGPTSCGKDGPFLTESQPSDGVLVCDMAPATAQDGSYSFNFKVTNARDGISVDSSVDISYTPPPNPTPTPPPNPPTPSP